MRHGWPKAAPGQVIGLLGGSFDPAHGGHVDITLHALKRFRLDRIWWLVSPGNPLKQKGPAPLAKRMARARAVMVHPRVDVTDIEAQLQTRFTAETLGALTSLYPRNRFVWLMGADNLAQFHLWQDWRGIMDTTPIGVLARPGERISARRSVASQVFQQHRLPGHMSQCLSCAAAPVWCFVNLPLNDASSTEIRATGDWSAS